MSPLRAGICEDDHELRGVVRDALAREGFDVAVTATGADAVRAFSSAPPDVMVLDIGLPDADGRDVCQALRARGVTAPVLFLTARDALTDRLSGFHAGGDDYLTKSFALAELVVRVHALVRRAPGTRAEPAADRALRLDPAAHAIAHDGASVSLTPTEFRLLAALAARPGEGVGRAGPGAPRWPGGPVGHHRPRQHAGSLPAPHPPQAPRRRRRRSDPHRPRRRLPAPVSFRNRVLLTSLVTLAVGLGALVVAGNVVLNARVHAETSSQLRAHAEAQLATLDVSGGRVRVRDAPNDAALDRRAWVLAGARVIERADNVSPALDRLAIGLGRAGRAGEFDGPSDIRLRVEPIQAPGA